MHPAGWLLIVSGVFPRVPVGVAEVLLPAEQDLCLGLGMGGTNIGDSVMSQRYQACLRVMPQSIMWELATLWASVFPSVKWGWCPDCPQHGFLRLYMAVTNFEEH